ncbi:MAG: Stealth CR1 domain-containing protein [candidate division Zixibacteria bacterium]|nr:Stealth CR1 domain-containing protein [candidate division Zixibacteria bacterium]
MNVPAIDLVYTWVNGEDPAYRAQCRQYAGTPVDLNPERYRDAYELLRYSLRSVDLFAPWIRDIYLFTCRPQTPAWLDTTHPRIHVIHHDELIAPEYLPTFSWNVIESYLHGIPSRSDYLLYMNDDFLFGAPTRPEDFLTPDGKINVFGSLFGEALRFRVYDGKNDLVSLGPIEHAPILIFKPYWAAMQESFSAEIERTRRHRFRQRDDVRMDKLYRYHLLAYHRDRVRVVSALQLLKRHRLHKIKNEWHRQEKAIRGLERMRPVFYCLNDDQRDCPDEPVVELVRRFLDDYYPGKSPFEK